MNLRRQVGVAKWIRHRLSMHEVIKLIKPEIQDLIPSANSRKCALQEYCNVKANCDLLCISSSSTLVCM